MNTAAVLALPPPPDKVDRLENEIQSANEVKVSRAAALTRRALRVRPPHASARVSPGVRGEADPVPPGDPPEANQQPEGRAGHEGEGHH